ncbi:MAG: hypothetical protein HC868_03680 [Sphingomonadales bacterium]|nr:hypothetical protein [Sphingomonadales bacterium]
MNNGERTITPVLRYHDPKGAAEWLCRALGFDHDHTSEGPDGQAQYISLRFGDCFVLICPAANSVLHHLMVQPAEVGGANTQMCYVTVQDLDAHSQRARAAGATIELDPEDDGAGGRFYLCRDPEGHLWSIGTRTHGQQRAAAKSSERSNTARQLAPVATVLLVLAGWLLYDTNYGTRSQTAEVEASSPPATSDLQLREAVADELARRIQAEMTTIETARKLEQEKTAGVRLKQELQQVQADLVQMRVAKIDAEGALADSRAALDAAEHALRAVTEARDAAERSSRAAADALALERARTKAAQDSQAVVLSKAAQLESALVAEKERRVKAEGEVTSLRERIGIAQPPPPAIPQATETASAPPEKRETASLVDSTADAAAPLPADAAKSGPTSPCALAIQGKVPFGRKGPSAWDPANVARLCRNAETSIEPAKCFDQLMRGQVDWGGSKVWMPSNALALCAGTRDASQTLNCFVKLVSADDTWRSAITRCRFK